MPVRRTENETQYQVVFRLESPLGTSSASFREQKYIPELRAHLLAPVTAGPYLALATGSIGRVLGNVVSSLGLISILFYALTGAAAVWQHRRSLARSPADFVLGGLLPGGGALFMAWVAVESGLTGAASPVILGYATQQIPLAPWRNNLNIRI